MVVVIQCKDQVGLVAAITRVIAEQQLNIISMRENVDKVGRLFFSRLELDGEADTARLQGLLKAVLPDQAFVGVNPEPIKKIAVLVTKEYHCLGDILLRNHFGTLGAHVQCVIGNHDLLRDICERFSVPFHLVSHEGMDKASFETALLKELDAYDFDYIVLAKFMRILSPSFIDRYLYRIINIHHSFLPAFIGANPYRRAFERGVKLIGATAHFVTNDLDEGPIIAQQIIPVDHTYQPADMMRAGKEVETSVLARALQLVLQDRVFIYHNKTVVFE